MGEDALFDLAGVLFPKPLAIDEGLHDARERPFASGAEKVEMLRFALPVFHPPHVDDRLDRFI